MDNSSACPRVGLLMNALGAHSIWKDSSANASSKNNSWHEFRKWAGRMASAKSHAKFAAILPYSAVYGKSANYETWAALFRHDSIRTVIQLPSGSLGKKNDQPFVFIYEPTDPYADREILFVDATQAPRASEHGHVLSEQSLALIRQVVDTAQGADPIRAQAHPLGGTRPLYLGGLPSMSKLVPRAGTLPSEQTLMDDLESAKQSVEKLRTVLRTILQ